ncbi:hypothetical protein TIFTF001_006669 [Ficus carica]|uniref:Uncharacterized protein n=1 Tax=Ficus carica TaxID=3494 RepID=A0AA88DFW4_FICCA|nr:hypothetical protein TIFTF001_006669 [Ficus carica]
MKYSFTSKRQGRGGRIVATKSREHRNPLPPGSRSHNLRRRRCPNHGFRVTSATLQPPSPMVSILCLDHDQRRKTQTLTHSRAHRSLRRRPLLWSLADTAIVPATVTKATTPTPLIVSRCNCDSNLGFVWRFGAGFA